MKFPKGTYSAFPTALMKGRSPSEQVVLAWLIYHANDAGECYPSYLLLEAETGISERNLIRITKKLEEEGILTITRQNRMSNIYQIKGDILSPLEKSRVTKCQSTGDKVAVCKGDKVAVESMNLSEPMNRTKEEKNITKKEMRFPPREEHYEIVRYLIELMQKNNPGVRVPKDLTKWAVEVEQMERLDERPLAYIRRMCEWCQQDPFWSSNILSTEKLRKHYDTMLLKAKSQYLKIQEEEKRQQDKIKPITRLKI